MTHRCIIVPQDYAAQAADLCAALAGSAGAGMFVAAAGDGETITHRFSNGIISEQFADLLPLTTIISEDETETRPADIPAILGLAASLEVEVDETVLTELLNAVDVSEQDWTAVLARLGLLQMVESSDD